MMDSTHMPGKGIDNLPLLLRVNREPFGTRKALTSVDGTAYTYESLEAGVRFIASMLWSAGIRPGDRVALYSENSPHWVIAYFAVLAAGAVVVPILPDFREEEIHSILEHSEARGIFISGKMADPLTRPLPAAIELAVLTDSFQVVELTGQRLDFREKPSGSLEPLELMTGPFPGEEGFFRADAGDLASIIYTSGTTGMSKGVMLTHENILSNAWLSGTIHRVEPGDRFLSLLPLAHTYESTIGMVVPLLNGARIHYIDRAPTATYLAPILREYRPTTLLTVPLIIEKIYAARIRPALYGKPFTRMLMKVTPIRKLLSRAAAGKLLKFFGGSVRFFGIGGAPLAPDVERFLLDGGFPYAIGYGLTETSPMIAGFGPDGAVYRSVGTVMQGVEVRIDRRTDSPGAGGEIVVKGPNVMKGYYRDPDRTKEAFTADGYLRTGDLGELDRNGILFIRGRLKNMILGPNGENIYPEQIEAVINREELVTESLVMEVKGGLVAYVHFKIEELEERLKHLKENAADAQHQVQEKIDEALEELLREVNLRLARSARLQRMIHQPEPFEKTPTQKIKRYLYTRGSDVG